MTYRILVNGAALLTALATPVTLVPSQTALVEVRLNDACGQDEEGGCAGEPNQVCNGKLQFRKTYGN